MREMGTEDSVKNYMSDEPECHLLRRVTDGTWPFICELSLPYSPHCRPSTVLITLRHWFNKHMRQREESKRQPKRRPGWHEANPSGGANPANLLARNLAASGQPGC